MYMKEKKEQLKLIYVAPSIAVHRLEGGAVMDNVSVVTPTPGGGDAKGFELIEENDYSNHSYNLWNDEEEE